MNSVCWPLCLLLLLLRYMYYMQRCDSTPYLYIIAFDKWFSDTLFTLGQHFTFQANKYALLPFVKLFFPQLLKYHLFSSFAAGRFESCIPTRMMIARTRKQTSMSRRNRLLVSTMSQFKVKVIDKFHYIFSVWAICVSMSLRSLYAALLSKVSRKSDKCE